MGVMRRGGRREIPGFYAVLVLQGSKMEHFRYEASPASEHSTRKGQYLRSIIIVFNVISDSRITFTHTLSLSSFLMVFLNAIGSFFSK